MKYDKAKYADRQLKGYGPIGPIKERLDPAAAFARVTEVAKASPTWTITYSDPATNTLEAVATSKLWHFNDDVVIQVRPTPDGASLIEMRSKSRDGIGDFGVNARRIRRFFDRVALARDANDQNTGDRGRPALRATALLLERANRSHHGGVAIFVDRIREHDRGADSRRA